MRNGQNTTVLRAFYVELVYTIELIVVCIVVLRDDCLECIVVKIGAPEWI